MHSTKSKKNSGAERSRFSGPGPECPEKSGYSGKKSGLSGLQHSSRKTDNTQFFNLA
jgi:hypothetical protein